MKLKNYKKLVLPTVMAALLVSIPVTSNAYTNTITIRANNGSYTVVNDSNQTSKNYYIISNGYYFRPQYKPNKPVEVPPTDITKPEVKPDPKPEVKPDPKPEVKPEPKPEVKPDPKPEVKPEPKPEVKPDPKPEVKPEPTPDTGSTSNGNHSLSAAEIKMVELVNKERVAAGLKALQIDVDLAYVARIKSQDMNDNKYFSHDSPTYGSPFDMMKQFGIKYRGAAENIAKNSSVEAAHNSLMRSSGHKANIMNSNYTHIGIGIVNGHYTQMFISK